jgi:hypothetical protein
MELVVALVGGWNGGGEWERKKLQKQGRKAGFWPTLDLIFSPSGHEIYLYL